MTVATPYIRFLAWVLAASTAIVTANLGGSAISAAAETNAEAVSYVVQSWRTIDGLPQNSATALAQTPDGYLWIGTQGGLARFDGARFVNHALAEGLKGLSIKALLEDGHGGLWIATLGGGLSHWQNGAISTLTTSNGLAHNDVLSLAPAEPGAVWVGTRRGLQHLGPNGFEQVGQAEGVSGAVVALANSPGEGLWFSVWTVGLFRYQNGHCEAVEPALKVRNLFPWSMLVDAEGALWMGMGNAVVMRRHKGEWTEFNRTNGLPSSYIACLAQGAAGEIWAGSLEGGLYVLRAGRFHAVPGTEASIRSLKAGPDGIMWVGTRTGGLCRLARAQVTSYPVGDSGRGQVNGLVEDPPGQFWVGVYEGGGLFRGHLDHLAPVKGVPALSASPFLRGGIRMRDGAVYFAGVKRLVCKKPGAETISDMMIEGDPRALCEGVDGSLWLGTGEGELQRLLDGLPQGVTNGTFPAPITGLVRGPGAAFWVGTQGAGLFHWDAGHVQRWTTAEGLPTDNLRALLLDGEGILWIGTVGGGLAWLEQGHLHSVSTRKGLGDDTAISQILDDGEGNLWLGCNRGIYRVPKRELQAVAAGQAAVVHPLALDEADGILSPECTGGYSPAGLRAQSGTLYFSTVRGIVAMDPAQFGQAASPPAVLVEEVLLDGKPVPLRANKLSLPPGSGDLEIRYTAFNYAKPEHLRFRHRLAGRNEEWVEAGPARSIQYSRLRPGDYEFQVSAANEDGRWNATGARLAFTVQPFIWQTFWFRLASALVLMGCGGAAVWGVVRARLRRALEQERLAVRLRESEQWLHLAADSSGVGLWCWDFASCQIWATEKARLLYGFSAEEPIPFEKFLSKVHPDDLGQVIPASQRGLREGTEFHYDCRIVRSDGSIRWLRVRARAFLAASGEPQRMTGVSLDVTDRKRIEEALEESEARFRTVANTAPVLIWMAGTDKLRNFFNKSWLDFTGRSLEQELGNGWAEGVHTDDLAECLKIYIESFDARRPFTMEYRLRRHDGEYRWVSDHGVPRYDAERNFLGYIGSCLDLTERKRAEAELLRERAELAHVARVSTMGELAASVAHELNQPLGAILANAEAAELFLRHEPPALDDLRAILADIRKDDERAGEVIRRMRALLSKRELEQRPLEINTLVEDVLQLVSGDAALRGVSLGADLVPVLPKIAGDRVHLQQVLLNLIINGMDAMAGQPRERRRISVRTRLGADGLVELAVIDAGHGIPPDKLPRIFEPFYTTKPNGMGMGLSIARTIIQAHHGSIWAENNPAGGATFRFALPVNGDITDH